MLPLLERYQSSPLAPKGYSRGRSAQFHLLRSRHSNFTVNRRDPQSCLHRAASVAPERYECAILRELFNRSPEVICEVELTVCAACCRSFLPSVRDLNPVLASLVWARTHDKITQCDEQKETPWIKHLKQLNHLAEASIPIVSDEHDDLPILPCRPQTLRQADVCSMQMELPSLVTTGTQIRNWNVGITTAPRRLPTLADSIESLKRAGWDCPHLFIDGDMDLPRSADSLMQSRRQPMMGAWRNYYQSVVDLLSDCSADFILLAQDDAWWSTHLPIRKYLEELCWPVEDRFLVSLYCCASDTAPMSCWRRYEGIWQYGAVAMIFSRKAAEEFVRDPVVCGYGHEQKGGIDTIIGEWANRSQIPVFVPTPSLVQHIGDVSSLWETSRAVGMRRASRFIGDEILPPTVE